MNIRNNVPWEMLGLLSLIIFAIVGPFFVGLGIRKAIKHVLPEHKEDSETEENYELVKEDSKDNFLTTILLGWVICFPIFYVLFDVFQNR